MLDEKIEFEIEVEGVRVGGAGNEGTGTRGERGRTGGGGGLENEEAYLAYARSSTHHKSLSFVIHDGIMPTHDASMT